MLTPKIKNEKGRIIFMDMDGFIARYEREAYLKDHGVTPGLSLFEDKNYHYFRTCRRDDDAYALVKQVIQTYDEHYFLTTVPETMPWHIPDKYWWLDKDVPEFNTENLIIATSDKAELIMVLIQLHTLTKNMILIDDYNPNLNAWKKAGGTAIKYLNGINTPGTFDGPEITPEEAHIQGIINLKLMSDNMRLNLNDPNRIWLPTMPKQ